MKNINLKIGMLNCHGLPKTEDLKCSKHFIWFLQSQSLDILVLQETYADDKDLQTHDQTQFQSASSFWSQHVGIVSLNPSITLSLISSELDGQVMHINASHSSFSFSPINLIIIYAPAHYSQWDSFYTSLLYLPFFCSSFFEHSLLLGDFNHQILSPSLNGVPDI